MAAEQKLVMEQVRKWEQVSFSEVVKQVVREKQENIPGLESCMKYDKDEAAIQVGQRLYHLEKGLMFPDVMIKLSAKGNEQEFGSWLDRSQKIVMRNMRRGHEVGESGMRRTASEAGSHYTQNTPLDMPAPFARTNTGRSRGHSGGSNRKFSSVDENEAEDFEHRSVTSSVIDERAFRQSKQRNEPTVPRTPKTLSRNSRELADLQKTVMQQVDLWKETSFSQEVRKVVQAKQSIIPGLEKCMVYTGDDEVKIGLGSKTYDLMKGSHPEVMIKGFGGKKKQQEFGNWLEQNRKVLIKKMQRFGSNVDEDFAGHNDNSATDDPPSTSRSIDPNAAAWLDSAR